MLQFVLLPGCPPHAFGQITAQGGQVGGMHRRPKDSVRASHFYLAQATLANPRTLTGLARATDLSSIRVYCDWGFDV